ncbi:glycerophosphoinositol inositolphosphodiesterase GDPD2-like [Clavelina lepadiformis]|uniref:glycerophosphoinositol inositolphosphodiesterase GDPD2-like n=1 Tax=Clavelina lepadiformis TaxID=159417 RepID=UPI0040427AB3
MKCKSCCSLYSCKKQGTVNVEEEGTSKCEKGIFVFVVVVSFAAIIWLYCWSIASNDSDNVNFFLFQQLKSWFNWYILLLTISVIIAAYMLLLMVSALVDCVMDRALVLFCCHKVFVVVCLIIIVMGFILLNMFYPEEWLAINASFEMTGLFMQISAMVVMVFTAWYLALVLRKISKPCYKVSIYLVYSIVFLFIFTIPTWWFSSCVTSDLRTKPLLIGHRGAPTVAPENTLMSFEIAASCGAYGFESDIRFSSDGVPFVMHDDDLLRATDVADKFPQRKNDRAETFSWAELQLLNAGEWFLRTDPFLTGRFLNDEDKANITNQKIPSLLEFALLTSRHDMMMMFDVYPPPRNHTNHLDYFNVIIEILLKSGIPQKNVFWLYGKTDLAPNFTLVSPDPNESGIGLLNLLFSTVTSKIVESNASVISYTINEEWAFSRAWCQGVWAVTTDYCSTFAKMTKPSWTLSRPEFLATWITIDIVCLLAVLVIFIYFHKKPTGVDTAVEVFPSTFTIDTVAASVVQLNDL